MYKDDVVEEVRAARDAYARRFNYDLDAIFKDLREREPYCGHPMVSLRAKRFKPITLEILPDDTSEPDIGDPHEFVRK